jgi:hypothetical protein
VIKEALAIRNSPRVDAKNLPAIRYSIVSDVGNKTTVVVLVAALLSLLEKIERIAHGPRLQPRTCRVRQAA